ncbi:pH-response regulator protein palC [Plectosphaerella cucumerina]|uniref:pH-response regulator protein palC n=1 Tax=Plectosphaerella cucumerina TaxID=40658 RepID=A0A8K0TUT0_9PEZI|nr:pH-response regulator protein palC [Plectosphaerella cucumerina]
MPFPFVLPTTSSFSFSACYTCESHPSLPLTASTYRGVVRDELKKHKRLPPSSQSPHVASVSSALSSYVPYVLAIDDGLADRSQEVRVCPKTDPSIEWRPTMSESAVPGREVARVRVQTLEQELIFALSTLAQAQTLLARSVLHPLYVTTAAVPSAQERTTAIQTANKYLLDAASIYDYLAKRAEASPHPPPCADVSAPVLRGLSSLSHAEANLLAVLKDDPYPGIVAQSRNSTDKEYLYKTPDVPKVRAHLFARFCLAAADQAAKASSLCSTRTNGGSKVEESLLRYLEDTRRTAKARACRFFGIDAELGGETGKALAWLRAGLHELGVDLAARDAAASGSKKGAFGRFKKDWAEKREDRRVEKETDWGADGGRLEEMRVIEYLETKWEKFNNLVDTQIIPPTGPLLAQMPSGRDLHPVRPYEPPQLDRSVLEAARAPPEHPDDVVYESSDDETKPGQSSRADPVGAYPGSRQEYNKTPGYY